MIRIELGLETGQLNKIAFNFRLEEPYIVDPIPPDLLKNLYWVPPKFVFCHEVTYRVKLN